MKEDLSIIIRSAMPEDAPRISSIRARTIRTIVARTGMYSDEEVAEWSANYPATKVLEFMDLETFLVADRGGQVVGFGRLQIEGLDQARIRGVFVDADFVGRGIGSRIVRQLIEIAQDMGAAQILIAATLNARTFYERLGFRVLEQIQHATPSGAVIPALRMMRNASARS